MFCTQCGTENGDDSRFCKQCGHKLNAATSPPVGSHAPVETSQDARVKELLDRAYQARKEGDADQAVMLCREALRLHPDDVMAHALLSQLYEAIGEREMAIRA